MRSSLCYGGGTLKSLTKHILTSLVHDDTLWEWDKVKNVRRKIPLRGKPKVDKFEDKYYQAWNQLMLDNLVLPMYRRAYHLYDLICRGAFGAKKKSNNFLHYHFIYENVVDEDGNPETLMDINCAGCLWEIQQRLTEPRYWEWYRSKNGGRHLCYLDRWLQRHEDCQQEKITEEMIMECFSPSKGEQIQMF